MGTMTNPGKPAMSWIIRWLALPAACAATLTACGSSAPAPKAAAISATQQTCDQISGALADGPDPGSDLVGYAEAQIGPLSQVHPASARLSAAVARLDHAYQQLFDTRGQSGAAKQAVSAASKQVNSFCPGAAS
jgi:hypothetical protein